MRKILIVAALLAAAPLSAAAADGLSYTYVEGGWTRLKLDNDMGSKPELDGGYLRGSFALAENVNVFGGYTTVSKSYNYTFYNLRGHIKQTLKQPELGIGYHMPMSDRVDFTSDIAWVRLNEEFKLSYDGQYADRLKDHINAGRVTVGLRGKPSPRTEAWIKAGYIDGSDMDGEWVGTLGGQVNFTRTWGLTGEVQAYDGATQFSLGVRASF
ncbi:outer membrane beta-barrel protein [Stenotrophomonas sp. 24(2023)]|uniref:outer membrane beta-barrel protein n=1 Tax=Stenotrophomonas sp. 24(2023) TaxID=3068324 RepID=UPI0027E0EA66|nr:outer membrane beta-barrel protein [Stenotrophomonas sp. 24(2023)]WMJ67805.1 hypothetical protein Q9R17_11295 [Stenotrophomonas sp. 24(2023)]